MPLSRTKNLIIILSGILIFFVGILLPAFANLPGLFAYYATTKYLAFLVSLILSVLILILVIPQISIPKRHIKLLQLGGITLLILILSFLFSQSLSDSLLGQYTLWEFNAITYIGYTVIFFALLVFFYVLKESELLESVFALCMYLLIIAAVIYGIGEYYVWQPQTGYISNYVSRISLGFRNPLYAGFFIGILWNYCFTDLVTVWLKWQGIKKEEEQKISEKAGALKKISAKFIGIFKPILPFLPLLTRLVLFVGITVVFMLTFTRSAWIASGVVAIITLVWLFFAARSISSSVKKLRTLVTAIITIVLVATIGLLYRHELSQRNSDVFVDAQNTLGIISRSVGGNEQAAEGFFEDANNYTSAQIRLLEWQWGFKTLGSDPKILLIGAGPDALSYVLPKYRDVIFNNIPTDSLTRPSYIRNMYIDFLLMHGLLFVLSFLAFCVYLVIIFTKRLLRADLSKQLIIMPGIMLFLAFLAQGVFYYPTFTIILVVIFALSYVALQSGFFKLQFMPSRLNTQVFLIPILLILIAWTGLISYSEFKLDTISLYWVPSSEVIKGSYDIPINSNIFKRIFVYHFATDPLAQKFLPMLEKSQDLDDLRVAAAVDYVNGRALQDNTLVNKSIEILNRMHAADPTSPVHNDELGLRYLYLKDFTTSRKYFDEAIRLKRDYWYAYMHTGELLRQICQPKEAIAWYEKAQKSIPQASDEILEAKAEIETPRTECKGK